MGNNTWTASLLFLANPQGEVAPSANVVVVLVHGKPNVNVGMLVDLHELSADLSSNSPVGTTRARSSAVIHVLVQFTGC